MLKQVNPSLGLLAAYCTDYIYGEMEKMHSSSSMLIVCGCGPLTPYVELLLSEQNTILLCGHGRRSHRPPPRPPHLRDARTRSSTKVGKRHGSQLPTVGTHPLFLQPPPTPIRPNSGYELR